MFDWQEVIATILALVCSILLYIIDSYMRKNKK